jgi:hypothetical protein
MPKRWFQYDRKLSGIITVETSGNKFFFRTDNQNSNEILAWAFYDDPSRGMTHKWRKMPKGTIEYFDIDNIPATVSYNPLLG